MRIRSILAVETSTGSASVALLMEDGTLFEERLEAGGVQGKALAPAIQSLLASAGLTPGGVDLAAVGLGPGSYTGLRVGIALARAFAFGAGCPVVGVPSFHALALQCGHDGSELVAVAPAGMGEYYHGVLSVVQGRVKEIRSPAISFAREVAAMAKGRKLRGEGALEIADAAAADVAAETPRAWAIARLGRETFLNDGPTPEECLLPLYLRRSKAEMQWERRKQEPPAA